MRQKAVKETRRQIRKAIGPVAAERIEWSDQRARFCASILRRGLWGRLKWLILGT